MKIHTRIRATQWGAFCKKVRGSLPPPAILLIFANFHPIEHKFCTHIIRQCLPKFIRTVWEGSQGPPLLKKIHFYCEIQLTICTCILLTHRKLFHKKWLLFPGILGASNTLEKLKFLSILYSLSSTCASKLLLLSPLCRIKEEKLAGTRDVWMNELW